MKKILTLILAFMALSFPLTAQDSNNTSTPTPIILQTHPKDNEPNPKPDRAPIRIAAEAWYQPSSETISLIYYGEASGEANLYKDGQLIDSSSEINTSFSVSGSGFYTIEIITDSWTATGSIEI